jgi:hypothetical protein
MRIAFLGNFGVDYSSETHHAASLEALGHQVIRLQELHATVDNILLEALASQMFVWVHTHGWDTPGIGLVLARLREERIPMVTYHLDLWMGLARERDMRDGPYWELDHFFTVDKLMADWLNSNTPVRGHFLPAAVFDRECYISTEPSSHANDVIFVGSKGYHPEWAWRPQLIDWLRDTYGARFTHIGGDGDTGTLRGDDLNRAYANSKVAVGDTLCLGFKYPYYCSDRLFEAAGRGGFQLFPRITGLDDFFTDGEHLRHFDFGDFDQLESLIDYYLDDANAAERETIRRAGQQHAQDHHTYLQRWQSIIDTVFA